VVIIRIRLLTFALSTRQRALRDLLIFGIKYFKVKIADNKIADW